MLLAEENVIGESSLTVFNRHDLVDAQLNVVLATPAVLTAMVVSRTNPLGE